MRVFSHTGHCPYPLPRAMPLILEFLPLAGCHRRQLLSPIRRSDRARRWRSSRQVGPHHQQSAGSGKPQHKPKAFLRATHPPGSTASPSHAVAFRLVRVSRREHEKANHPFSGTGKLGSAAAKTGLYACWILSPAEAAQSRAKSQASFEAMLIQLPANQAAVLKAAHSSRASRIRQAAESHAGEHHQQAPQAGAQGTGQPQGELAEGHGLHHTYEYRTKLQRRCCGAGSVSAPACANQPAATRCVPDLNLLAASLKAVTRQGPGLAGRGAGAATAGTSAQTMPASSLRSASHSAQRQASDHCH